MEYSFTRPQDRIVRFFRDRRIPVKLRNIVLILILFAFYVVCVFEQSSNSTHGQRRLWHVRKGSVLCATEKTNFVYVKMVKAGSTTLNTIFHRFGYLRKLQYVLPINRRIYLGWPYQIRLNYFRPSLTGTYNILCEHSVFNRTAMSTFMPKDSVYIASIREPYAQFLSTYNYYKVGKISGAGQDEPGKFLKDVEHYDRVYQSPNQPERACVPDNFSMTRNLQAHILGVPLGYPAGTPDSSKNLDELIAAIKRQLEDLDVIIILEYLNESLVLLKRKMCWGLRDILYKPANVANYRHKGQPVSTLERLIHKAWNRVDYILYEYANRTFWERVAKEHGDFFSEVRQFSLIQNLARNFCLTSEEGSVYIKASRWHDGFNYTRQECQLLDTYLLDVIKQRYDKEAKTKGIDMPQEPSKYFC